jgi:hypothetical protein
MSRPKRRPSSSIDLDVQLPTPGELSRLTASWTGKLPVRQVTQLVPRHGAARLLRRWMQAAGPGLRLSTHACVRRGNVVARVDASVPNPGPGAEGMLEALRCDVEHLCRHVPLRISRTKAPAARKAPVVLKVRPRDVGFLIADDAEELARRVTDLFGTLERMTDEGSLRALHVSFEANPLPQALATALQAKAARADRAPKPMPYFGGSQESHVETVERLSGAFRLEVRLELERALGLAERTTLLWALETHLGVPVVFGDGPFLVDAELAEMLMACHLAALADPKGAEEADAPRRPSGPRRRRLPPLIEMD